jgi:hypothetical protein
MNRASRCPRERWRPAKAWKGRSTGGAGGVGIDRGFVYRYRWLEVTADLHDALVQGCNAFVNKLVEAVRKGGESDAT